jgi:2-hydroxymuconate-semialdehyde hydrolase
MPLTDHRQQMLAGVPVTARTIEVDGVATAVLEAGDGPPLLLLHGGIECGGVMWTPVLSRLAEHRRIVVPDIPGLGDSAPVARLDVDTFGRWVTALVERLGLEQPTVVAHSLIGSLTARFATRHRGLVARLVIYAAPAVDAYRMPLRLRYVAIRFAVHPSARNAERFERFALLDLDATRRRDPRWFAAFDAYTRARARVPHVKKTMRQLVATATKRIPKPTWIASAFRPHSCGVATIAWSRSLSVSQRANVTAGPYMSSTTQPTRPTSSNPTRSSTLSSGS